MKPARIMITIAIIATTLGGCKATAEYQQLAKAGSDYTNGMDELLMTAGAIRLDASSELLLKGKVTDPADYQRLADVDQERLNVLAKLRQHNQLLARYFNLLNQLATADAPLQAQQEIGTIVDHLNDLGNQLRGQALVPNKDLFQIGASLLVNTQIRGALHDELQQRQDVIRREFLTQKVLLQALGDSIKQDLKSIQASREQRLVLLPLLKHTASGDEWINTRRTIMTMNLTVDEFDKATTAADRFGETFDDFVTGKFNRERLNTLLSDISAFLNATEHLKHSIGAN